MILILPNARVQGQNGFIRFFQIATTRKCLTKFCLIYVNLLYTNTHSQKNENSIPIKGA